MANYFNRQRLQAADILVRNPSRELRVVLGFSVAYVLAAVLTGLAMRAWPHPLFGATYLTSDVTYVVLFKIGLLLVVPAIAIQRAGYGIGDLTLGWRPTQGAVARLGVLMALGVLINGSKLPAISVAAAALAPSEAALRIAFGAVLVFFTAALPEEIVYRWALQTRIERLWGRFPAILVAAVLFTAWHLPTRYLLASGAEGRAGDLASVLLGTGLPVLVVGLVFGWAWDRWRNLPALVALHWGIDTLPSIASFLQLPP
ncbi:MAG: type II CAAX endopeptidase family protein [Gemmatimonadaceae bacterium]|jgi:membrane protease YdiL (CAAX protease family)